MTGRSSSSSKPENLRASSASADRHFMNFTTETSLSLGSGEVAGAQNPGPELFAVSYGFRADLGPSI
jgi:hypothetical protein